MSASENSYIYLIVIIVNIGAFINGNFISWTSPMMVKLGKLEDNPLGRKLTEFEEGMLSSICVLGNTIGCFLSGYLSKNYGRKKILVLFSLPAILGCIIIIFSENICWIFIARAIWGITIGSNLTVIPLYLGEVVESKIRGKLSSSMNIFLYFGFLYSMCAGPNTSFRIFNSTLAFVPVIYILLLICFIPESPFFLVERNLNEAEETLRKLRATDNVDQEIQIILKYNRCKIEKTFLDIFKNDGLKRALLIGCGLMFFQQCSGISIIMGYGQKIFEENQNFLPSDWSAIVVAAMQVVFGFIAPSIVEKAGRKNLLMFSEIGSVFSLLLFGLYYFKKADNSMTNFSWLPLASVVTYKFMYTLGLGPVPWILVGELFPREMKGIAAASASVICSWTTFVLCFSFNWMKDSIGIYGVFWSSAGIVVLALIFTIFYVFETKGKNLQEIQELLNE